ncbi:MAG: phosphoenolpyruvate--protein phosphotransferase [Oscillospiraceae bacterium]|nr:phosphoenolpyruvate--protein phosphotransferase [Oscillospiraceae bacterium]
MKIIEGVRISDGIAIGTLYFLKNKAVEIGRKKIDDPEKETARFDEARIKACLQLDRLYEETKETLGEENAAIFDIHKMMLEDLDYIESVMAIISEQNVNAEYAVERTAEKFSAMFSAMDDDYMKERAIDVLDISGRIQKILCPALYGQYEITTPSIIIADDITPGEAVGLDKKMVLGIATVKGGVNSHTAILARSLALPAVFGFREISANIANIESLDGKHAILDGFTGKLYIEPDEVVIKAMSEKLDEIRKKRELLNKLKGLPSVTADGRKINLYANVNHVSDIDDAVNNDAEGIGLFRSEFLFLDRKNAPTEEEQFAAYKKVAAHMNGKKTIIRTLDIGADKQVSYFKMPKEENPAMGLRAVRLCLSEPQIFKTQLRALYRASAFGNISIMIPMVTSVWEVGEVLKLIEEVKSDLKREEIPLNNKTEFGIMVETPAAVIISAELAEMVDFFSIGTNDLTQYTLAADRQNSNIGSFYEPHHPAVMKMIEMTVKSAKDAGIWVGICGEIAADLELTEIFLNMGVDELSVSPNMLLPLRERIRAIIPPNATII